MQHDAVEKNIGLMMVLILVALSFGTLVELVPLMFAKETNEPIAGLQPLSALELEGRDIYIREGCNNCHSQMIRPLRAETERYGHFSVAGEFVYDHPFLWGSKRTGPDLARVGGKYPNVWHLRHMADPRAISVGSNMPSYAWLLRDDTDVTALPTKLSVQRALGVPYPDWTPEQIRSRVDTQAKVIAADLKAAGAYVAPEREIIALIAYLQVLGRSEVVAATKAETRASQ